VKKEVSSGKNMFKKGDYVVYPMHGVGTIVEITTKTVLNEEQKYFVVELINTKMRVMVPIARAQEIGLRHIIKKNEVAKIIKLLQEEFVEQEEDWKIRYQNNLIKVKSGSILSVSEVCRNLYKRARDKELSIMERKLYESAYSLVINEVALAKNLGVEEASNMISEVLSG
jgi:CarD family transcriptional regulator